VAPGAKEVPWVTTEMVAAAADVGQKTVLRWAKIGLLPAYQVIHGGARARSARWPAHAPEQARWIRARIEEGLTFPEIFAALERGDFKKKTP
jgi:DNA-binding transcriptional MerR regulator